MNTDHSQYEFKIDIFSPNSLPMARLAEYLTELSKLYGERDFVHFKQVAKGSAILRSEVDTPARIKVNKRIYLAFSNDAPPELVATVKNINRLLLADKAVGTLRERDGEVIHKFPGRNTPITEEVTIHDHSDIEGVIVRLGGKDESAPIWIRNLDGEILKNIECTLSMARDLAPLLYGDPVRLSGRAQWTRNSDGFWELKHMKVASFERLDDSPLSEVVKELCGIENNDWTKEEDPQEKLSQIRGDK